MNEIFVTSTPAKRPGGVNLDPQQKFALRLTEDGTNTYIGQANPGASINDAVWRIFRMDTATGLIIEWADGNSNFDNTWSNYASLNYS